MQMELGMITEGFPAMLLWGCCSFSTPVLPLPLPLFFWFYYIYIFNKRIYFLAVTHRLCCIKPPLHGEAAKCRGKADTLLQIFHVFAKLAALRLGFSNPSYFPCNLSFHSPPPPLSSSSPPNQFPAVQRF